ncbi:MAG: DEAD/DEAH box helicase family protein [Acidobacteriia bacterium]|nr:DEAD/DEAH box helicase family protein [Terriglobia bacterium]
MHPNEARTRKDRIDPALVKAGWSLADGTQVGLEIPVDGYDAEPWNGVTDYCLYQPNGEVIAVVEAKKQIRDPNVAREQARHYITEICKHQSFQPFAFLTNGLETYFWDEQYAAPRLVAGFFTLPDLQRLLYLRQNATALSATLINPQIAGRIYQQEAIRRLCEAFTNGKRRALMVMATGTGKTRTTVALIDLFFRANQARKVLFLADRDALVDQALKDGFHTFLPNEASDRIYTHNIDKTKRLYVATLQTISRCYEQFSPSFFDLLVFDEAHRSIFNRMNEVMEYFDSRMIGLTATPAGFIDRDTFRVFHCDGKTPTALYTYAEAVQAGHLVDFSLYQAKTSFQRDGIKGVDLSEEDQNALIEQGIDPDDIDYSGTDIERTVSNRDTLVKQWEEFMEVCFKDQSGQLPGKSIVFAMTQPHAQRLRLVFEQMYPQYKNLVEVTTSDTERVRDGSYGDGLITKFKKNDLPRIAISVDMLDTGIDVPEVVNLAFMKPVQSQIKLWQMIGRGTRNHETCRYYDRLPDGHKSEFKILDFWDNQFDRQAEDKEKATVPVLVTIFNTRLRMLEDLILNQESPEALQVKADLQEQVRRIPTDAFTVRKVLPAIEQAWQPHFWRHNSAADIEFLRMQVAPLLRMTSGVDVAAETFISKVERLKLQALQGNLNPADLQSVADDVGRLPEFVHKDPRYQSLTELCLSDRLASATPEQLTEVGKKLAPQMKNRKDNPSAFLKLDLPDFIAASGYITLSEGGERLYVTQYRERVEKRINDLAEKHPTILAIQQGRQVTELQLVALERTLREVLSANDVLLTTDNIRKAYGLKLNSFLGFLRHVLSLDNLPDYGTVVQKCFDDHIQQHAYNADQLRFLRVMQSVLVKKRHLFLADLYEGDFTAFGDDAVERMFTPPQISELMAFTQQLNA